jgi:uncharacterized protein YqhQ
VENKPLYGGQAVIEGVMMRGPRYYAVACRRADGEIVVEQESVESIFKKLQWMTKKPLLRGVFALIDTLVLGMKALKFSADIAMEDAEKEASRNKAPESKPKPAGKINDIAVGATMVASMALGVGIFMIGPHLLVGLMRLLHWNSLQLNLGEGFVRLAMFVIYVAGISYMNDIKRVWQYHGAEHKVVNTYESGLPFTPENFAVHSTIHPRCGTNFMMFVLVLSIIFYSFIGWGGAWYMRILYRLLLLPVIAAVGYELIRLSGRFRNSAFMNVVMAPGLWLQRLTTRVPDEAQIEVARKAFEAVYEREEESSN